MLSSLNVIMVYEHKKNMNKIKYLVLEIKDYLNLVEVLLKLL